MAFGALKEDCRLILPQNDPNCELRKVEKQMAFQVGDPIDSHRERHCGRVARDQCGESLGGLEEAIRLGAKPLLSSKEKLTSADSNCQFI